MLPKYVTCDECHQEAKVRGYGRVEYDWPDSNRLDSGQSDAGDSADTSATATPTIRSIRLAVDCPHCGVRVQDHYPNGRQIDANSGSAREALLRLKSLSAALRGRPARRLDY